MASALAAALLHAPAASIFNIVDQPLRYGDYVDAVADMIGAVRPRRIADMPMPPSWRCTNEAAQTVLEWVPRGRIWPDVNELTSNTVWPVRGWPYSAHGFGTQSDDLAARVWEAS
jgi:hypothetical protein